GSALQRPVFGSLRPAGHIMEPPGGLRENVLGLTEDESDLRAAAPVTEEAGARDGRHSDLTREPDAKAGVVEALRGRMQRSQVSEVGENVVRALRRQAPEACVGQSAVQEIALLTVARGQSFIE